MVQHSPHNCRAVTLSSRSPRMPLAANRGLTSLVKEANLASFTKEVNPLISHKAPHKGTVAYKAVPCDDATINFGTRQWIYDPRSSARSLHLSYDNDSVSSLTSLCDLASMAVYYFHIECLECGSSVCACVPTSMTELAAGTVWLMTFPQLVCLIRITIKSPGNQFRSIDSLCG